MKAISLYVLLITVPVVILIIAGILFYWKRIKALPWNFQTISLAIIFLFAFFITGYNIGLFTGLSVTPVIQYVIPAVLTFVTGFITYIFLQKDTHHTAAYRAAWIVLAFNIGLLAGGKKGMVERAVYDRDTYNQELKKQLFLKRIDYYIKYRNDTGIQRIVIPLIDTIAIDSVKISVDKLPKITP